MRQEKIEITVEGQQNTPAVLTTYLLDTISVAPDKHRPAVIVCPGGGYSMRSDRESEPVILQFMAMGCHAFLLDYSVAPSRFPTALLELAEAVALVRDHAESWRVDCSKVFVCGFSAGGHLACSLGTFWDQDFVTAAIRRRKEEIRPDGMILCYPVISSGEFAHGDSFTQLLGEDASQMQRKQVSLEQWVRPDTPRAFIWHTDADALVPVENSLLLALAMRRNGVPLELHIYPIGRHGLSLANPETGGADETLTVPCCEGWISLVKIWLALT